MTTTTNGKVTTTLDVNQVVNQSTATSKKTTNKKASTKKASNYEHKFTDLWHYSNSSNSNHRGTIYFLGSYQNVTVTDKQDDSIQADIKIGIGSITYRSAIAQAYIPLGKVDQSGFTLDSSLSKTSFPDKYEHLIKAVTNKYSVAKKTDSALSKVKKAREQARLNQSEQDDLLDLLESLSL